MRRTCPNCEKEIPANATDDCPNCGVSLPPIPALVGKPEVHYLMRSRWADIALGLVCGFVFFVVFISVALMIAPGTGLIGLVVTGVLACVFVGWSYLRLRRSFPLFSIVFAASATVCVLGPFVRILCLSMGF